ncbi:GNAT family N-acetyltransferase [Candidatus Woesearchaeota archaeon]|nr:GNAT family N-acetyltransferase [Candidatus Woesearchaeota archaeon]
MKIRKAKIEDLNQILEFTVIKKMKSDYWHMSPIKFVESYIKNKNNFFFLAIENNKIIGIISGELWKDKKFAYLGRIDVKRKNNREIAKKLFKYLIKFCKENKITLINTYLRKSNKIIMKLYANLGLKKKSEYVYMELNVK